MANKVLGGFNLESLYIYLHPSPPSKIPRISAGPAIDNNNSNDNNCIYILYDSIHTGDDQGTFKVLLLPWL